MKILTKIICISLAIIITLTAVWQPMRVQAVSLALPAGAGLGIYYAMGMLGGVTASGAVAYAASDFEAAVQGMNEINMATNPDLVAQGNQAALQITQIALQRAGIINQISSNTQAKGKTHVTTGQMQVQTAQGSRTIEYIPVIMSTSDLIAHITGHARMLEQVEAATQGMYWCFQAQDFRPIPSTPTHSSFVGVTEGGLPIFDLPTNYFGSTLHQPDRQYRREIDTLIRRTAVQSFRSNRMLITMGEIQHLPPATNIPHDQPRQRINIYRDGHLLVQLQRTGNQPHNIRVYGFVGFPDGAVALLSYTPSLVGSEFFVGGFGGGVWRTAIQVALGRIQTPTAPSPVITRNPTRNLLDHSDAILGDLRARAGYAGDVVVTFPVFPDNITAQEREEIMAGLTPSDLVRPADYTDADTYPRVGTTNPDDVLNPPAPPATGTGINQGWLGGILGGITGVLNGILSAILSIPNAIAQTIQDTFFQPEYVPMLPYLPEGTDFDFRINLMNYFPFSIPRDLVEIISIILGQSPAAFAGATELERAVFLHYQQTGYITPEGFALIEPMMIPRTVPRIDVPITIPSFAGGTIDNSNPVVVYTFVVDFGDYPTLITIIHFSVFLTVMFGLIKITPKVITW